MTNDADTVKWDVFICHASEDKDSIARPLADVLSKRGLEVWYDEFSLSLGDSLRRSIDHGLQHSGFGVVILSRSFFEKEWPQRELDGLAAKEASHKGKTILPIWHCIERDEIEKFSPVLADKIAISTKHGLSVVADGIVRVVGLPSKGHQDERRRLVANKWIFSGKPNEFGLTETLYDQITVMLKLDLNGLFELSIAVSPILIKRVVWIVKEIFNPHMHFGVATGRGTWCLIQNILTLKIKELKENTFSGNFAKRDDTMNLLILKLSETELVVQLGNNKIITFKRE